MKKEETQSTVLVWINNPHTCCSRLKSPWCKPHASPFKCFYTNMNRSNTKYPFFNIILATLGHSAFRWLARRGLCHSDHCGGDIFTAWHGLRPPPSSSWSQSGVARVSVFKHRTGSWCWCTWSRWGVCLIHCVSHIVRCLAFGTCHAFYFSSLQQFSLFFNSFSFLFFFFSAVVGCCFFMRKNNTFLCWRKKY